MQYQDTGIKVLYRMREMICEPQPAAAIQGAARSRPRPTDCCSLDDCLRALRPDPPMVVRRGVCRFYNRVSAGLARLLCATNQGAKKKTVALLQRVEQVRGLAALLLPGRQ